MKISIEKALPEHTEAISRICTIGWLQTVEGKYSEEYKKETIEYWYNYKKVREDIEKGHYTYVAKFDNKVVGTIGGAINDKGESEIYVFYLDEKYRYKGIGTKLLEVFTNDHIKRGATKQYVSVEEDNKLGIPFYESRGFRKDSKTKRYLRLLHKN